MAYARHLVVLLSVSLLCVREPVVADSEEELCGAKVHSWAEAEAEALSSLSRNASDDHLKLHYLLFFLHVPRTGGRTFHQCFLKHLFRFSDRCPRSYDELRIDRKQPSCRLISTHDDYSVVDNLTPDLASVVTFVRQPVDRVVSAYEFAIEVAARSLKPTKKGRPSKPAAGNFPNVSNSSSVMSTWQIWPWKHLVPFMLVDLLARKSARLGGDGTSSLSLAAENPVPGISVNHSYDAAMLAMPFHEFVHRTIADDLVHNGATFQIAGLTNTSYLKDATDIRACVVRFPNLGKHVLDIAKRRLDNMLFVGLTDRQTDSARLFLKLVGHQISLKDSLLSMRKQGSRTRSVKGSKNVSELTEEDITKELMVRYDECVDQLRQSQVDRRTMSLKMIPPIKFSSEIRKSIPADVIQEVRELNRLDAELFAHAQRIFVELEESLEHTDFHFDRVRESENSSHLEGLANEDQNGYLQSSVNESFSGLLFIILPVSIVVVGVVIYLVSKREGARVKET